MSRIQPAIVKSLRVNLCEKPPKRIFWWDPKMPRKSVFEVVASCIASLPALAEKLQTHFSWAFWGPKKILFGGCSQRLTLKDFTIASCICDFWLRN